MSENIIYPVQPFFVLCIFALLVIYGFMWTKFIMKKKLFKPIPLHEVMAMENELCLIVRRKNKIL